MHVSDTDTFLHRLPSTERVPHKKRDGDEPNFLERENPNLLALNWASRTDKPNRYRIKVAANNEMLAAMTNTLKALAQEHDGVVINMTVEFETREQHREHRKEAEDNFRKKSERNERQSQGAPARSMGPEPESQACSEGITIMDGPESPSRTATRLR